MWPWYLNVTLRRTDGRTISNLNTALCTKVHRAVTNPHFDTHCHSAFHGLPLDHVTDYVIMLRHKLFISTMASETRWSEMAKVPGLTSGALIDAVTCLWDRLGRLAYPTGTSQAYSAIHPHSVFSFHIAYSIQTVSNWTCKFSKGVSEIIVQTMQRQRHGFVRKIRRIVVYMVQLKKWSNTYKTWLA